MLQRIFNKSKPSQPATVRTSKGTIDPRAINQRYSGVLPKSEIEKSLSALQPETPWAHYFDFGNSIYSVEPTNEKFYRKATGLKAIGELLVEFSLNLLGVQDFADRTVLDIACGEAGHSMEFASRGARVTGVEGRQLYVERAKFAARAFGYEDRFKAVQGDVRRIEAEQLGTFDLVLMLGILHHLDADSFGSMLRTFHVLTKRIGFIYTHVSELDAIAGHRLKGPVTSGKYEGYLFQEHAEDASAEDRTRQVRASLDNTYSFWAREESLLNGLKDAGFSSVFKILHPHPYQFPLNQYRVLYGCLK